MSMFRHWLALMLSVTGGSNTATPALQDAVQGGNLASTGRSSGECRVILLGCRSKALIDASPHRLHDTAPSRGEHMELKRKARPRGPGLA